ncbi:hypothetical protein [Pseudotabrizicola algicola]|uniref:Uncharacterized protein n=1 Tax=Pseudotabrizicola algicola TaxID=2709381 RepID=A0A6B3RGP1_9RHOB|nr:hypothetical protein [Pseudotabrizicola algicola]NEX45224.1 hypothetical protein [Pseudotabrizicola algicola]
MNKYYLHLVYWTTVFSMVLLSFGRPKVLGSENSFLQGFVNHEFLSFMGVIVTITLATATNTHIELRKKEATAGEEFLRGTRAAVKKSAYSLIWLLVVAVAIVVTKPIMATSEVTVSLFNSAAVATVLWGAFVIYDLAKLAFKL